MCYIIKCFQSVDFKVFLFCGWSIQVKSVVILSPTPNGKNPSCHSLDIIPPEGLQVSDLSISPFWSGHSIFGKSHAKWANLTFLCLITSDRGRKQKIPSCHNLDISINYVLAQCGPKICCFAMAIKFFVETHLLSCKSHDIVWLCMSPTL